MADSRPPARRDRWGELRALTKQGALIAAGPFRRRRTLRGRRVVLFLHGFLATGEVLRPLADTVHRETGLPTGIFRSPMHSIDFTKIVDRFERFVGDEVPTEASISLVGHSLGGLVARWYAQERDRERRVDRIVTLATPHAGTGLARFTPEVLRDALDPLGPTITQLRERRSTLSAVPHVNIVAGKDLLVRPRSSALALDDAATHELEGVGHNEILYFPKTARLVVDALR